MFDFKDTNLDEKILIDEYNKIFISSSLFLFYFLYSVLIWIFGCCDLICYFLKIPQGTSVAHFIGIAILSTVFFKSKKYFIIGKGGITPLTILGILLIVIFSISRITYPDRSFDVLAFHLIAQKPGFANYFSNNYFGTGGLSIWGLPLADKMFWYFRFFLGYRCGTVLNTISLIISYIQVIFLLDCIFYDKIKDTITKIIFNSSIFALMIIFNHQIILMIGTYMIDIISLPFILEAQICLLRTSYQKKNNKMFFWFIFLQGFCLAFKLTNIVFIVSSCLFYFFLMRKKITLKLIIMGSFVFILPIFPYILFNWYSTGNPIFPYYNTIFKSDYFPNINYKDSRWGPTSLKQIVFWPVYLAFKPFYRQSEIPQQFNLLLQIGVLEIFFTIINLFIVFVKKRIKFKIRDFIVIFFIFSSVFWALSTGYSRYFMFGFILLGILAFCLLVDIVNNKFPIFRKCAIITTIILLLFLFFQNYQTIISIEKGRNWVAHNFSITSFKSNYKRLFRDKDVNTRKDITTFFLTSPYAGIAFLLNSEATIINADYLNMTSKTEEYYEKFNNSIIKNNHKIFYDIQHINWNNSHEYMDKLKTFNFHIIDVEKVAMEMGEYYLIKLCHNSCLLNSEILDKDILFDSKNISARAYTLNGFSGAEATHTWTDGKSAEMSLFLENVQNNLEIKMEYWTFDGRQPVKLYANEKIVADYVANGEESRTFVIPKDAIGNDGWLMLRFDLPEAHSPASLGGNDIRELALAFRSIRLSTTDQIFDLKKQIENYYELGEQLSFEGNHGAKGNKYVRKGFSGAEDTHTWTNEPEAEMFFLLGNIKGDLELRMEYWTFDGRQPIRIYANDKIVAEYVANGVENRTVVIPKDVIAKDGQLMLRFYLPWAHSPASLGVSGDNRELALAMRNIVIMLKDK